MVTMVFMSYHKKLYDQVDILWLSQKCVYKYIYGKRFGHLVDILLQRG